MHLQQSRKGSDLSDLLRSNCVYYSTILCHLSMYAIPKILLIYIDLLWIWEHTFSMKMIKTFSELGRADANIAGG